MMASLPSALEHTPAYADPWPIISDALDELLPAERVEISDYAAEYRHLNNTGGGFVGRWSHDVVSYLAEPMDMLNSRVYTTTAIVGPGQPAKTTIGCCTRTPSIRAGCRGTARQHDRFKLVLDVEPERSAFQRSTSAPPLAADAPGMVSDFRQ